MSILNQSYVKTCVHYKSQCTENLFCDSASVLVCWIVRAAWDYPYEFMQYLSALCNLTILYGNSNGHLRRCFFPPIQRMSKPVTAEELYKLVCDAHERIASSVIKTRCICTCFVCICICVMFTVVLLQELSKPGE